MPVGRAGDAAVPGPAAGAGRRCRPARHPVAGLDRAGRGQVDPAGVDHRPRPARARAAWRPSRGSDLRQRSSAAGSWAAARSSRCCRGRTRREVEQRLERAQHRGDRVQRGQVSPVLITRSGSSRSSPRIQAILRRCAAVRCRSDRCSTRSGVGARRAAPAPRTRRSREPLRSIQPARTPAWPAPAPTSAGGGASDRAGRPANGPQLSASRG